LFEILQNLLLGYVDGGGEFYLFISKIRQMILSDMPRRSLGGVPEEFVPGFQGFTFRVQSSRGRWGDEKMSTENETMGRLGDGASSL
jgi:hypothetical protein